MKVGRILLVGCFSVFVLTAESASGLDGGTLRVNPRNGWKAFEVITVGNNPVDAYSWAMPDTFDGVGAWMPDANTLRLNINHENSDATVSEVNLGLGNFKTAIQNVINTGATGGVTFVNSARQAYGQWSANGGSTWTPTSDVSTTAFTRFCSSQLHPADTFGAGRGFADNIYITGEEGGSGRLFALDVANRDFYQLSGAVGSASGGIGGMPSDPWENAALLDTGDTTHVALLLSPDGGTQVMKLYVGDKGKDTAGNVSSSFLARNGLAYGRYYNLIGSFPATTNSSAISGTFSTSTTGALSVAKLEDVDTNPNNGIQVVQGIQESGLFVYDFNLVFSGGVFSTGSSTFKVKKIQEHVNDTDGSFGDADNVEWTLATLLNGFNYTNGLIFVNEDSGTGNGETWMTTPSGGGLTLIGDTISNAATETSGILDISSFVGYRPGSILLTTNQGSGVGSLTVLINPNATLVPEPSAIGLLLIVAMAALPALRPRPRSRLHIR